MDLIVIDIFLQAFLLCILLYLFARHEADFSFSKVTIVTAFIVLGSFFIDLVLSKYIGPFTIIPAAAFFFFMIIEYCWVSWKKAIVITIVYHIIHTLLSILVLLLVAKMFTSEQKYESVSEKHNRTMQEGVNVAREILGAPPLEGTKPSKASKPKKEEKREKKNSGPSLTDRIKDAADSIPLPVGDAHQASKKELKYSGFMTGADGSRIAMVNGEPLAEGKTIKVKYRGSKYKWRLIKITKNGPEWEPVITNQPATN